MMNTFAPVAQLEEQRRPKAFGSVRIRPGAPGVLLSE